jgi:hypothetical protein
MSLLRFLTVGHSFENVKDHRSPYRMTAGNWLPRFGRQEEPNPPEATSIPSPPASNQTDQVEPAKHQTIEAPVGVTTADAAAGRWDLPATGFRANRAAFHAKTAVSKVARLYQGELWTDQVKPLRNDLRESDVEVALSSGASNSSSITGNPVEPPLIEASLRQTEQPVAGESRNSLMSRLMNPSRMLG